MSGVADLAKLPPHGRLPNGEGFGGFTRLDPMDVAGALGMGALDDRAYQWGMLKWAGDHGMLVRVTNTLRHYARQAAIRCGKRPTPDQVAGLATLAVLMGLHDAVCDRCNGSGLVAAKPCEKCCGSGRVPMSGRRQAEIVGIARETWREGRWSQVVAVLSGVTAVWDSSIDEHLKKYLPPGA
jgi:hypothetical protein